MTQAAFNLILIIVLSGVLYHVAQKRSESVSNPLFMLANVHLLAFLILLGSNIISGYSIAEMFGGFDVAIVIVALSTVVYTPAMLFAYRSGAKVSKLSNIVTSSAAIGTVLIGTLFLAESFKTVNAIGLVCTLLGVYLLSSKGAKHEKQ